MISGAQYQKIYMKKETDKNMKKKITTNDWTCTYCSGLWSDDFSSGRNKKWLPCDKCDSIMHVKCIPRQHLGKNNLSSNFSDEECDYLCEICFEKDSD